jgi:hypothetical protein
MAWPGPPGQKIGFLSNQKPADRKVRELCGRAASMKLMKAKACNLDDARLYPAECTAIESRGERIK